MEQSSREANSQSIGQEMPAFYGSREFITVFTRIIKDILKPIEHFPLKVTTFVSTDHVLILIELFTKNRNQVCKFSSDLTDNFIIGEKYYT
jgi:hypothetical protein